MKLVYVAFDNVSHQPKSTDIFSMNQCNDFKIESSYVANIKERTNIYEKWKPDVLFIDTLFDKNTILDYLNEFQKINDNKCKIILSYKNKSDKKDFVKTKIPARFFPYKVPSDIISSSFNELTSDPIFFGNKTNDINILIDDLNLNQFSLITRQFKHCLEILSSKNSQYLLFRYTYNALYSVSKLENISLDTIRKSVYKVKDDINKNISDALRHSIFKDNDLNDMQLPEFFEYLVEYLCDDWKN